MKKGIESLCSQQRYYYLAFVASHTCTPGNSAQQVVSYSLLLRIYFSFIQSDYQQRFSLLIKLHRFWGLNGRLCNITFTLKQTSEKTNTAITDIFSFYRYDYILLWRRHDGLLRHL